MTVLDDLYAALENLESAREKAGTGSAMMIAQIIEQVSDLIKRTENIQDNAPTDE